MAKVNRSANAAKDAARAARAAAEADLKARDRKIRIFGAGVVALVMAGLLAIPFLQSRSQGPSVDTSALLPKNVSADSYGVQYGTAWTDPNADSIPLVQVWEDFQCPACASFEVSTGKTITELAASGKIRLEWRPTIFLDNNLKAQNTAAGNPNSSLRASIAFGCAADQDKASEFHSAVFQAQPGEGRGFSNSDLQTLGTLSGVTDLETFAQCVESKKYEGWVNNSYDAFSKEGVTATPTVFLNGKEMSRESISDAASFIAAVEQAAATK